MATLAGFGLEEIDKIEMAVDEACTNAICHQGERTDEHVQLCFAVDAKGIRISLCDFGRPFPLDKTTTTLEDYMDRTEPGGLGSYIMRRFMDEVEVQHAPSTGNEIRLTKFL